MDRWDEYNDGALTPPAIVQHDVVGGEHLIWGWTGTQIIGPLSRREYEEQSILTLLAELPEPGEIVETPVITEEIEIVCQDGTSSVLEVPVS